MLRSVVVRVLALVICLAFVTALVAAEGTVVSFDKGTVEVKIGDKTEKFSLKGVKVTDADGKDLKGKDAGAALKKDAKVDVTKDGDKVTAVKILK